MLAIVVDIENTTTKLTDKHTDFSPYNEKNKLVSIGWKLVDLPEHSQNELEQQDLLYVEYLFLSHHELELVDQQKVEKFKGDLAKAKVFIAHNAKYDMCWLAEAGFDVDHLVIDDTMIREYVMARGRNDLSFKLSDLCIKYDVAHKKTELIDEYFKNGVQMDRIPIKVVEEYGIADVVSCWELYQAQHKRLNQEGYTNLKLTVSMMNEFCKVLVDMERAGIPIDISALLEVEESYKTEEAELKRDLNLLISEVMGDTVVNLDSPQQLSEVIYSRRIKKGKEADWLTTFNIGKDDRGKNFRRPKMNYRRYAEEVNNLTQVVLKTEVSRCIECEGVGKVFKLKLNGQPYTNKTKCKNCDGEGLLYNELNEIAGFKMKPQNIAYTTVSGFSTSSTFLDDLLEQAKENKKDKAYEFITKVMRLSSISSYLSNFVGGISSFKHGNILHPNFNQCITATGRLSSTRPNLQNQPREATFPIRKVFKSRWRNGKVIEVDFSQLEFRAAVHLAEDVRGKKDIIAGIDIHAQTRDVITSAGQTIDRQGAKSHTFKPLYGGRTGTEAERAYYRAFLGELYRDIGSWHLRLSEEAITKKIVTLPTGRQYIFADVERGWNGTCTKYTQVVNYPVQGFATADIVPVATIRLWNEMRQLKLKSKLVLTVHDSIVADVCEDEIEVMTQLMKNLAKYAEEELEKRYGITMFVPLACEVKIGYNLMETKKVA